MKIVGLGDSITWGYPFGSDYSWVHFLGKKLSCDIINFGINGECLPDMRARVSDVINQQPDIVIVMGGTNDAFECSETVHVVQHFKAILDQLHGNTSAKVVVGIPIPLNYKAEERSLSFYRKAMRQIALEKKLPIIDFYSALVDPTNGEILNEYNEDGVHPNQKGYARMAEEAYLVLSSDCLL